MLLVTPHVLREKGVLAMPCLQLVTTGSWLWMVMAAFQVTQESKPPKSPATPNFVEMLEIRIRYHL